MAVFFRSSDTWIIDYHYDGKSRRWFKVLPVGCDVRSTMVAELAELYGDRAKIVAVRKATSEEELSYLRGEEPKNILCPTGREPTS